ncbi:hypothetical protein KFK09_011768 [Dendrobium nobile]|uniref:Uncharacterized protein n=1 Tax=Dendrobium nobile TaxID=94219 RepID=A0A8T3BFH9_DENNO|nr:hypothetical protein KFK09_011768 [Dendrobium nobile]
MRSQDNSAESEVVFCWKVEELVHRNVIRLKRKGLTISESASVRRYETFMKGFMEKAVGLADWLEQEH